MAQTTLDILLESLAESLETTAFISLMPPEPDTTLQTGLVVSMELDNGARLHIAAARELGSIIAANMLALEPGSAEADARAEDALKEILNVTAGLYLSRALGDSAQMPEMSLPVVTAISSNDQWKRWVEMRGAEVVLAEGYPVAVAIEGNL
jgi:hypothetical protein